jgi:1,4-dihydroxy-2-naphthoyl-CoA hydrolase
VEPTSSPASGPAPSPDAINARIANTLPAALGVRFVAVALDCVVAELPLRDDLLNGGGIAHGGTLMAFADTTGAIATVINLPPGAHTTTIESKTNFLAAARGGILRAEATPLHRGRRTMVWQTRILDENGLLVSLTTQTQLVMT